MSTALARTKEFRLQALSSDHIVAILHRGIWKESNIRDSFENAQDAAYDVHCRTGFVVQLRDLEGTILAQYGEPTLESEAD